METQTAISDVLTATDPAGNNDVAYRLAPDVVLLKVWDGSSRLLDLTGQFFGLPAESTELLVLALRSGDSAAATEVARRHGIPLERVREDLRSFLHNLLGRRLIVPHRERSLKARITTRWKTRLLGGCIRATLRSIRSERRQVRILLTLAHLACRQLGWAGAVEVCRNATPETAHPPQPLREDGAVEYIDETVRTAVARHVLPIDCKARALCCWILLRDAGLPARLVVGIDLFPFLGHCWCESGAYCVADHADRRARFTPILQY